MIDLTVIPAKRLSDKDNKQREWQLEIERKAQAAQDECNRKNIHAVPQKQFIKPAL